MLQRSRGELCTIRKIYPELGLGRVPNLEKHIHPYRNGRDLASRPRGVMLIDLYGLKEADIITQFPEVYQHIYQNVKPERDVNNAKKLREIWWEFGSTRGPLRKALIGLSRYITTPETAKHRIFQLLDVSIRPDHKLVNIPIEDAYVLGVLSSRFHVTWAMAAGGNLGVGNDSVYNSSRCFDPFPFPNTTPAQRSRIRELAEQLDAHRKRQQAQHATLALTDLYNVVEKLKAGDVLTAKDQTINQQGLASVVLSLHQQLDAAVAEAYGWPTDLPESEILTRLVHLNHERTAEEQAGHIRYLRPNYQAPGQQQIGIDLGLTSAAKTVTATATGLQDWPQELAQQMQALRNLVQQAGQPLSAPQVASAFRRTKVEKVQPLLDTLATLALLRLTPEGSYAV